MTNKVPILPHHRIAVDVFDEADGVRFAELFRQVWAKLPLSVRRGLLRHWRQGTGLLLFRAGDEGLAVHIELRPSLNGKAWGTHTADMGVFTFACPTWATMPDKSAMAVIAHELGHAWIAATGRSEEFRDQQRHDYGDGGDSYKNDPEEIEVRRIQAAWGFPDRDLTTWERKRFRKPTNDKGE